jgi:hypothetical protein
MTPSWMRLGYHCSSGINAISSPVLSNYMKMTCDDCGCSLQECVESISPASCPHCSLSECCCWPVIQANRNHVSSSSEREMILLCLSRKLGHGLDDDIRRAGNRLRDILVRDFERETALASVFVGRNDLAVASQHKEMSHAIHNNSE